jgi:iron(III) transport system permease protein
MSLSPSSPIVQAAPPTKRWPRLSVLQIISTLIVTVLLVPILYLIIRALGSEDGLEYLLRERTLVIVTNSLVLVGLVTFTAIIVGVPFAWLTARTDLPFRRVWLVLGLLPMVIPSYLGAATYIAAFGPRGMLVQNILEPLFEISRLPDIRGLFGAWLAITLFTYPYVVLPVRAAILNADQSLEEAARSLGLSRWRVFWQVTLPQLRPAIAAGSLMTALYTLSDFGVVGIMRYNAFTRAIYLQYENTFNRERAAVLALVLVAITFALILLERRVAITGRNYRIGTGTGRRPQTVHLGRWRVPAMALSSVLIVLGVGVPVIVLLTWLTTRITVDPVPANLQLLTLNTTGISAITAIVATVAAIPLALLVWRSSTSRLNNLLVNLAYVGNVLPGIVVGLALVFFVSNYFFDLYQTWPILVLGYSVRYLPFSLGATRSALTQINPRLEEAGRSLGLRAWQVTLRITVPLASAGIIAGTALIFLNVMKELPTTLILAPIGFRTFATRIWFVYNEAMYVLIGTPGVLLIAVSAISLFVILWRDHNTRN